MGSSSEIPTEIPIDVFVPTEPISFEEFEQLTTEEQEEYLYFWDDSISYNEVPQLLFRQFHPFFRQQLGPLFLQQ